VVPWWIPTDSAVHSILQRTHEKTINRVQMKYLMEKSTIFLLRDCYSNFARKYIMYVQNFSYLSSKVFLFRGYVKDVPDLYRRRERTVYKTPGVLHTPYGHLRLSTL
jgi:hypothetical protein